jgi:DNA mismatch repair protein MSH4
LNPLTDLLTIETRLDVVELFLRHSRIYSEVADLLSKFPDFEKLSSGLVFVPKSITQKNAKMGIDILIFLKHSFKLVPKLVECLESLVNQAETMNRTPKNPLILSIIVNLKDLTFVQITKMIDDLITDSTTFSKNSFEMRHQECFAIRPNIHGHLDVARKTFLQSVEDIHQFASNYSAFLGKQAKVSYNSSRGYYLTIKVLAISTMIINYVSL